MRFTSIDEVLKDLPCDEFDTADHDRFRWIKHGLLEWEQPLDELWMSALESRF